MIRILGYDASLITALDREAFAARVGAPAGRYWLDVAAPSADELAWLQETMGLQPAHVSAAADRQPAGYLLAYPRYLFGATAPVGLVDRRVVPMPIHFFLGQHFLITIRREESVLLEALWESCSQVPQSWRFGLDQLLGELIEGMTQSYVNTERLVEQGLVPLQTLRTFTTRRRHRRAALRAALQYGELHILARRQATMLDALCATTHEALDANVAARLRQSAYQVDAIVAAGATGQAAATLLSDQAAAALATQRSLFQLLLLAGIFLLLLLQLLGVGG